MLQTRTEAALYRGSSPCLKHDQSQAGNAGNGCATKFPLFSDFFLYYIWEKTILMWNKPVSCAFKDKRIIEWGAWPVSDAKVRSWLPGETGKSWENPFGFTPKLGSKRLQLLCQCRWNINTYERKSRSKSTILLLRLGLSAFTAYSCV